MVSRYHAGCDAWLITRYRRYEINFRIALFFSAATIAGAFGGLLARLIQLMNGVAGLEGWVSLLSPLPQRILLISLAVDLYSRGYTGFHQQQSIIC